jgi:hypothetical protein
MINSDNINIIYQIVLILHVIFLVVDESFIILIATSYLSSCLGLSKQFKPID